MTNLILGKKMKITKKYIIDSVNKFRIDLIESVGIIREIIQKLNTQIENQSFQTEDIISLVETIKQKQIKLESKNVTLIANSLMLTEDDIRLFVGGINLINNLKYISLNIIEISELLANKQDLSKKYFKNITSMSDTLSIIYDKLFIAFTYRELHRCKEIYDEEDKMVELKNNNIYAVLQNIMNDDENLSYEISIVDIMSIFIDMYGYFLDIARDIVFIFAGEDIKEEKFKLNKQFYIEEEEEE